MLQVSQFGITFRSHLVSLVRLLYGLAIVTGTATALKIFFDLQYTGDKTLHLTLSIAAFLIGIADFVIYHLTVSRCPYRNVLRLIFDIGFPILIFVLFNLTNNIEYFLLLLFIYFSSTIVYLILLWLDNYKAPKLYHSFTLILTILIGATYLAYRNCCSLWSDGTWSWVIGTLCLAYFIENMIFANSELTSSQSDITMSEIWNKKI